MGIINIHALANRVGKHNSYSYVRVKNMLNGIPGRSSKKEIRKVRQEIERELNEVLVILNALEKL